MICTLKREKVAVALNVVNALVHDIGGMERETAEEKVASALASLEEAKKLCDDCGEKPAQFSSVEPMLCPTCFLSQAERKIAETQ